MAGLAPRRVVELRPYVVGRLTDDHRRGFAGVADGIDALSPTGQIGVDAKIGITSGLVVDATINPDFGQIEADPMVLNLTRFETLLPETRVFFLEGVDVLTSPMSVFYSRRIGQAPSGLVLGDRVLRGDGSEAEVASAPDRLALWGAAKIAGKVSARASVTALVAVTGSERVGVADGGSELRTSPPRLWSVLRGRVSGGGATYIGAHATMVKRVGGHLNLAELDHDAFTQAIDGQWQANEYAWRVVGQLVLSERVDGPVAQDLLGGPCRVDTACRPIARDDGTRFVGDDIGWGGRISVERSFRGFIGRAEWESLSPQLDLNGVGYQTNFGVHHGTLTLGRQDVRESGPFQRYAAELLPVLLPRRADHRSRPLAIRRSGSRPASTDAERSRSRLVADLYNECATNVGSTAGSSTTPCQITGTERTGELEPVGAAPAGQSTPSDSF